MIGPAGSHGGAFPAHYEVYVDVPEEAGYKTGYTGKGWGPGNWQMSGRSRSPAGPEYKELDHDPDEIAVGINKKDYAANFRNMTEDKADELVQSAFTLEKDLQSLKREYITKMGSAISPIKAARFLQVENQIEALMRVQLAQEIPLIQKPTS